MPHARAYGHQVLLTVDNQQFVISRERAAELRASLIEAEHQLKRAVLLERGGELVVLFPQGREWAVRSVRTGLILWESDSYTGQRERLRIAGYHCVGQLHAAHITTGEPGSLCFGSLSR